MEQAVYYVNCYSCGRLIEAVCPMIDISPSKVVARKTGEYQASDFHEKTQVGCGNCRSSMLVYWYVNSLKN